MEEFGLDADDYGDEGDSDFELNGGDEALYDAAMDEVDELGHLRDTLARVGADPAALAALLAGITVPEERAKFEQLLNGVDALLQREADVTAQLRALDAKK